MAQALTLTGVLDGGTITLDEPGQLTGQSRRVRVRVEPLETGDVPREEQAPPSRWARLAQRIAEDPVHLDGYSEQLLRDAQEVRDDFAFLHDRES